MYPSVKEVVKNFKKSKFAHFSKFAKSKDYSIQPIIDNSIIDEAWMGGYDQSRIEINACYTDISTFNIGE